MSSRPLKTVKNLLHLNIVTLMRSKEMNEKITFKSIRVPESLMEDIKVLKSAYEECYGKKMTFEDVIRKMMASIEDGDPAVWEMYSTIQSSREEMQERINALKNS